MRQRQLALRLAGVSVQYGGLRALSDIDLDVPVGTIVGLIGPNGAGKTTLFDAVTGLVELSEGRVLLFGRDVAGWPMHRRARLGLGRTFQRLELFGSLTVLENVVVALESSSAVGGLASELLRRPTSIETRTRAERRAIELLELVGLRDQAGARAADLPIGLARLCELARALAIEPKLLLLDEPSSGLNEDESAALADVVRRVSGDGRSVLLVEHDMSFVLGLSADVYVLDFGEVIAQGSPDAVRADPRVQAAYLGAEVRDPAAR